MTLTQHERQIISEIFLLITTSMDTYVDIAAIIAQYPIAPATVIRAYKKTFAKTPANHRRQILMSYAKGRIQQGIQIKNVANELGYKSLANFSRTFKKVFSQPPSNFKPPLPGPQ